MDSDPTIRLYKEHRDRLYERLTENRSQTDAILESLQQSLPTVSDTARLDALGRERARLFQDYLNQTAEFLEYVAKREESNRRSQMTARRPKATRSQAKIEEVSLELTTNLRLERVDDAMKELLAFLSDADFFSPNATTGRRRRLRTLQHAIEKALEQT